MKKLFVLMIVTLFLISFSSAFLDSAGIIEKQIPRDYEKLPQFQKDALAYPDIQIKEWLGLGSTVAELSLKEHTASCGENCYSVFDITTYSDSALIDGVKFYTIDREDRIEQPIRSYQFYIQDGTTEKEVNDYEYQCSSHTYLNGTIAEICNNVKVGSHIEETPQWTAYSIGEKVPAGSYTIKLEGTKKANRAVDWIIDTQGKTISEWSTWGTGVTAVDTTPLGGTNTYGPQLGPTGENITVTAGADIYVNQITKKSLVTATDALVIVPNNDNPLVAVVISGCRATFTGDVATFPANTCKLTNGVTYGIVVNSSGGTYTGLSGNNANPVVGTHVTWQCALAGDGNCYNTQFRNIASINTSTAPSVITINSPADKYNTTVGSITFNATVSIVGATGVNMSLWTNSTGTFRLNQTKTITGTSDSKTFQQNFTDGSYLWGIQACDSDGACGFSENRSLLIDLSSPNVSVLYPTGIIPFAYIGQNISLNYSITDNSLASCWKEYNGVNTSIVCNKNNSLVLSYPQTITIWANDSSGNVGKAISNWNYTLIENGNTYNAVTYETASETFIANVTGSISSAALYYNGTAYSGTVSTSGSNKLLTATIAIPTGAGTKNWFWSVNGGETNLTNYTQTVTSIQFGLCNSTLTTQFVKYIFKNETSASENVTASLVSSFTYWIGSDVNSNKTYSFTNSTENVNFTFCANPANIQLNVLPSLSYANTYSISRNYQPQTVVYSNTTTIKTLYLLPNAFAQVSRYKTINNAGTVVTGAFGSVSRVLNGQTVEITSGYTDSAGLFVAFLDPTVSYDYLFTKSGVGTSTFSLVPNSADTYTITLGSGINGITNGTQIGNNLTYSITPSNVTLQNNTLYPFTFTVSGQGITFISMNITNSSGAQIGYKSSNAAGTISLSLDTGNNTKFIGYYIISTGSESISATKVWGIGNYYVGDYSLFNQLQLATAYGISPFVKILIAISLTLIVVMSLTKSEFLDTSESKILVGILMIWAFSLVGWLDTGLVTSSGNTNVNLLAQFSSQYGIALVSSGIGAWFIFRRVL